MLRSGPLFLILRYGFRGGQRSIADLSIADYAEMWNFFALPCAVSRDLSGIKPHIYGLRVYRQLDFGLQPGDDGKPGARPARPPGAHLPISQV
jgi:hypothetical protein